MSGQNWERSLSKRTRHLMTAARSQGWAVDCTANGHVRFTAPNGEVVIGSSGGRSELDQHHKRTVKRLKRLGLKEDS